MKKTITIKSSNGGPDRTVRLKYSPVMLRLMGGTYAREVDRLCKPLTGISTHIKQKTGFKWSRENTNDEKAGRDTAETMHTNVTSHQRKLEIKMGHLS